MAKLKVAQGLRVFILIWFGQLVSLVGSGLTSFALGIWVYQRTGSVTLYTLLALFTTLPGILISPLAGALIDRWDRRLCMILSDCGAGLGTLIIALLLFTNQLGIWQIYLAIAISSIFNAFQWPAYTAATTLLVPKKHLGRASGMVQAAEAIAQLSSPALAGILLVTLQLQGVILIDFATFIFAFITLLLVRFPNPEETITEGEVGKTSLLRDAIYGWHYIRTRPGLVALLTFFFISNFFSGIVSVLVTPLVLAFAPVTILGTVLSVAGSGMLVGSLVMSFWGGGKPHIYSVLNFLLLRGLCVLFTGLQPSVPVFFFAGFLYFFGLPITKGSSQAIWQTKVAPSVQGRVFAVRRMITWASIPLAHLIAGPLTDYIFKPLLTPKGPLANTVGRIIGVGEGYGIALLFIAIGLLTVLTAILGYLYPRLRLVENELPDAVTESIPTLAKTENSA